MGPLVHALRFNYKSSANDIIFTKPRIFLFFNYGHKTKVLPSFLSVTVICLVLFINPLVAKSGFQNIRVKNAEIGTNYYDSISASHACQIPLLPEGKMINSISTLLKR